MCVRVHLLRNWNDDKSTRGDFDTHCQCKTSLKWSACFIKRRESWEENTKNWAPNQTERNPHYRRLIQTRWDSYSYCLCTEHWALSTSFLSLLFERPAMRLVRIESSAILNFTRSIRLGLTSIQNLKFANDNLPFIFAQLNFPMITLKHYSGEEDPDSRRTHHCSLQKKPTF